MPLLAAILAALPEVPVLLQTLGDLINTSVTQKVPLTDGMVADALKRRGLWQEEWKDLAPTGYTPVDETKIDNTPGL